MPMTVMVTRDVDPRFRGFLASCMLEIAPGVYTAPQMTRAVRERIWKVMSEWYDELYKGSIVLTWHDKGQPGGQGIELLGEPPKTLVECDGMYLCARPLASSEKQPAQSVAPQIG